MKQLIQILIIVASTGIGAAFGRYALDPMIPRLARVLPLPQEFNFGLQLGAVFEQEAYDIGLLVGIFMTIAVLGGLFAGIVLARRVGQNATDFGPKTA